MLLRFCLIMAIHSLLLSSGIVLKKGKEMLFFDNLIKHKISQIHSYSI